MWLKGLQVMKSIKTKQEIIQIGHVITNRINFVNNELSACPEGRLGLNRSPKGNFFVVNQGGRDSRKRTRVVEGSNIFYKLLKKELLIDELNVLQHDYNVLVDTWKALKGYDTDDGISALIDKYELHGNKSVVKVLSKYEHNEWANETFNQSDYRPEEKNHVTRHGLKVRSKSEALIAEKLYDYEIPFRYEAVLNISGVLFSPDFTVRRGDGKIFYWEHFGLTGDSDYMKHQQTKLRAYAGCGIVPWDNLIITYDNSRGDINLRVIDHEIQGKLLV